MMLMKPVMMMMLMAHYTRHSEQCAISMKLSAYMDVLRVPRENYNFTLVHTRNTGRCLKVDRHHFQTTTYVVSSLVDW